MGGLVASFTFWQNLPFTLYNFSSLDISFGLFFWKHSIVFEKLNERFLIPYFKSDKRFLNIAACKLYCWVVYCTRELLPAIVTPTISTSPAYFSRSVTRLSTSPPLYRFLCPICPSSFLFILSSSCSTIHSVLFSTTLSLFCICTCLLFLPSFLQKFWTQR